MTPYLQLSTLFQFTTNTLLLTFTVDGIEVMHAHPHPLQTLYLHSLTFVVMFLMWLQPTPELNFIAFFASSPLEMGHHKNYLLFLKRNCLEKKKNRYMEKLNE